MKTVQRGRTYKRVKQRRRLGARGNKLSRRVQKRKLWRNRKKTNALKRHKSIKN